jgi:hypothetical protein
MALLALHVIGAISLGDSGGVKHGAGTGAGVRVTSCDDPPLSSFWRLASLVTNDSECVRFILRTRSFKRERERERER